MARTGPVARATSLLAALIGGACASAPPPTSPAPPARDETQAPAEDAGAPRLCTLDVRDTPLDRALRYVRAATDAPIEVEPDAAALRVTIALRAVPWREALDRVAGAARCVVVPSGTGFVVARDPEAVVDDLAERVAGCRAKRDSWAEAMRGDDFLRRAALGHAVRQSLEALEKDITRLRADPRTRWDAATRGRFDDEIVAAVAALREVVDGDERFR